MKTRLLFTVIFSMALTGVLAWGCMLKTGGEFGTGGDGTVDPPPSDFDADSGTDGIPDGDAEIPPSCGNGSVEEGEQCDDGNEESGDGCENDCTFTCQVDGHCRDEDLCNGEETCDVPTHTCRGGTAMADGFVCEDDPRSICLDSTCRESTCGDGWVDAGGGEFCDPGADPTCSADCRTACGGDDDCPDDGDICNGDEYCDMSLRTCARRNAPATGTECGTDPRMVCIGGTCQESVCGDGFVDTVESEECDDANDVNGDGCDNTCLYSCHADRDCNDGEACNGTETCNLSTHTCTDPADAAAGTPCDDGRFCTLLDLCDGSGTCEGSEDPCADILTCTTAETCDESLDQCTYTLAANTCLIDGACYNNQDLNPINECSGCAVAASTTSWTNRPDRSTCTGGLCCGGVCRTGGNCCATSDCPAPACTGTASACSTFTTNQSGCTAQAGCTWVSGTCTGSYDCTAFHDQAGNCGSCGCHCHWGSGHCDCDGGGKSCSGITSSSTCTTCTCTWDTSATDCTGTAATCASRTTQSTCQSQAGCTWVAPVCTSYVCT